MDSIQFRLSQFWIDSVQTPLGYTPDCPRLKKNRQTRAWSVVHINWVLYCTIWLNDKLKNITFHAIPLFKSVAAIVLLFVAVCSWLHTSCISGASTDDHNNLPASEQNFIDTWNAEIMEAHTVYYHTVHTIVIACNRQSLGACGLYCCFQYRCISSVALLQQQSLISLCGRLLIK